MSELKPCPFCGSEPFVREIEPHTHVLATFMPDYKGGAFVECTGCTAAMSGDNREEVIEAWNKRPQATESTEQHRGEASEAVEGL